MIVRPSEKIPTDDKVTEVAYANEHLATDAVIAELILQRSVQIWGAVFSTGSISWSSALWHNCYENNISRITYNVLKRFISPTPFFYPHEEDKEKPFF